MAGNETCLQLQLHHAVIGVATLVEAPRIWGKSPMLFYQLLHVVFCEYVKKLSRTLLLNIWKPRVVFFAYSILAL